MSNTPKDPNRTCTVTGCDEPYRSLGYCSTHYGRFHRHGNPHTLLTASPKPAKAEPRKLAPGERVQNAIDPPPTGGTITLEEWRRLQATPAASVHIVLHQRNATGVVG